MAGLTDDAFVLAEFRWRIMRIRSIRKRQPRTDPRTQIEAHKRLPKLRIAVEHRQLPERQMMQPQPVAARGVTSLAARTGSDIGGALDGA